MGGEKDGLRADGKLSMITCVAALVELLVSPRISPVTVPGTDPSVLVKENEKLSALAVGPKRTIPAIAKAKIAVIDLRGIVIWPLLSFFVRKFIAEPGDQRDGKPMSLCNVLQTIVDCVAGRRFAQAWGLGWISLAAPKLRTLCLIGGVDVPKTGVGAVGRGGAPLSRIQPFRARTKGARLQIHCGFGSSVKSEFRTRPCGFPSGHLLTAELTLTPRGFRRPRWAPRLSHLEVRQAAELVLCYSLVCLLAPP
jgi:hypothetical protein